MKRTKLLTTVGLLGSLATGQGAWSLLEDFESYTTGAISPQSTSWSYVLTANDATVGSDAGNNYMVQGATNGDHVKFDNNSVLIADGAIGTYFFRVFMTGPSHTAVAVSPLTAATAGNGFNDGKAIVRFGNNSSTSTTTFGYNLDVAGSYSNLTDNTNDGAWYNVWVLIDNTANRSYEVHIQSDDDPDFATQTQLNPTGLAFRQGTADGDLQSLFFRTAVNATATHFDDLYIDSTTHNLSDPINPPVDIDSDGMEDFWEESNFGDLSRTATGDEDMDGLNNLAEFQAGTDPNDKDSDDDGLEDGPEVNATLNDYSTPTGYGATDPLNGDSDGDGVNDFDEVTGALNSQFANAPTDPNAGDSDGDGLPDDYELLCNSSPATALDPNDDGTTNPDQAPTGDRDGDGLSNLAEFDPSQGDNFASVQTRADLSDTDNDGYNDKVEDNFGSWGGVTVTGTNPTIADTDGDGLLDGQENPDLAFSAGAIPSNSDPNIRDTDQDGFIDAFEVSSNTNPDDVNSVPSRPSGFTLLEDFEGSEMVIGSTFDGVNGWSSTNPAQTLVADEPIEGSDQVGCLTRLTGSFFSAAKQIDNLGLQINEGDTGTLFFQLYATSLETDLSMGLSDQASPSEFGGFEAQTILDNGGIIAVRDGNAGRDTFASFAAGMWMNVWVVADNAADTVTVYYETPVGETGQFEVTDDGGVDPFGFRNGTSETLKSLLLVMSAGTALNQPAYVDNFYIDPNAVNLTTPATAKPVGVVPSEIEVTNVVRNAGGDLEITFSPGGAGYVLTSASPSELMTGDFTDQGNYSYDNTDTFTVPASFIAANPGFFFRVETEL
ncbi:hypothetical protein [Roseibacillus persicicus]|uniref:hypothetical protein n=1 Tax=Roseibacillus persicicus TaxID=454148 RepID=UPI00280F3EEE|nr:hypothetical protein [Roseibacillus persicicus]MDQ8191320.1 hypothetical protein [Roseibacillus persicicus]